MTREEMRDRIAALFRVAPGEQRTGDKTPGEIADIILDDLWPEVELTDAMRQANLDASAAALQRAERAEAGLRALTDVIARYDDAPGDAYIPIEVLRLAIDALQERT